VPALFDDTAALEHVDSIGVENRREPVRDENRHQVAIGRDVPDRLGDFFFRQRVERRRRFVEREQPIRVAQPPFPDTSTRGKHSFSSELRRERRWPALPVNTVVGR